MLGLLRAAERFSAGQHALHSGGCLFDDRGRRVAGAPVSGHLPHALTDQGHGVDVGEVGLNLPAGGQ
ncbi:hypothetical protein GE21DRAFT_1289751 [Neurospora crassa]|nr:hypothetical protein GE21DRAFT_1289751 [Neurospora crassa]